MLIIINVPYILLPLQSLIYSRFDYSICLVAEDKNTYTHTRRNLQRSIKNHHPVSFSFSSHNELYTKSITATCRLPSTVNHLFFYTLLRTRFHSKKSLFQRRLLTWGRVLSAKCFFQLLSEWTSLWYFAFPVQLEMVKCNVAWPSPASVVLNLALLLFDCSYLNSTSATRSPYLSERLWRVASYAGSYACKWVCWALKEKAPDTLSKCKSWLHNCSIFVSREQRINLMLILLFNIHPCFAVL